MYQASCGGVHAAIGSAATPDIRQTCPWGLDGFTPNRCIETRETAISPIPSRPHGPCSIVHPVAVAVAASNVADIAPTSARPSHRSLRRSAPPVRTATHAPLRDTRSGPESPARVGVGAVGLGEGDDMVKGLHRRSSSRPPLSTACRWHMRGGRTSMPYAAVAADACPLSLGLTSAMSEPDSPASQHSAPATSRRVESVLEPQGPWPAAPLSVQGRINGGEVSPGALAQRRGQDTYRYILTSTNTAINATV
jgi:hypothetical protein